MSPDTLNQNTVTEEQKEDARLNELTQKTDRSEDETKELETLKDSRQTRYQKRIDHLTWKAKDAEERLGAESDRAKQLEAQLEEEKRNKPTDKPVVKEETIKIGEKVYYTDETLKSMIDAGQMTESEAYKHQKGRDKAEIKEELREEMKQKDQATEDMKVRKTDAETVLKQHPNFSKKLPNGELNPNFDPEDPLYKLTTELYAEGMAANPRGFSIAVKRAKQILRNPGQPIDITDDISLHSPSSPEPHKKDKEVTLDENEQDAAISMFCRGDVINPATGRAYTEKEAIAKATAAKKERAGSRRLT